MPKLRRGRALYIRFTGGAQAGRAASGEGRRSRHRGGGGGEAQRSASPSSTIRTTPYHSRVQALSRRRVRRLRSSRARARMVAQRLGGGRANERARSVARRLRSHALGLGRGQCRRGQDAHARQPRDAAAARGREAGAHPLPHLHQGRGGGDAGPPVQASSANGRCCPTTELAANIASIGAERGGPRGAAQGAPPVRPGAGDAGRAEDPDHPRLLPEPAVALSARGRRAAGLPRARRPDGARSDGRRARAACWSAPARGDAALRRRRVASRDPDERRPHAAIARRGTGQRPAQARPLLRQCSAAMAMARKLRVAHGAGADDTTESVAADSAPRTRASRKRNSRAVASWLASGAKTDIERGADAGGGARGKRCVRALRALPRRAADRQGRALRASSRPRRSSKARPDLHSALEELCCDCFLEAEQRIARRYAAGLAEATLVAGRRGARRSMRARSARAACSTTTI